MSYRKNERDHEVNRYWDRPGRRELCRGRASVISSGHERTRNGRSGAIRGYAVSPGIVHSRCSYSTWLSRDRSLTLTLANRERFTAGTYTT